MNNLPIKRQHYLPQFYLKKFSVDGEHLHIYDKQIGDRGDFRYQSTRKIAFEGHFYTHRTKGGDKSDLEEFFREIESWASAIIKKIESRKILINEDREKLSLFIALMKVRVPYFKYQIEESYEKLLEKMMRMSVLVTPKKWLKKFYENKGKILSDEEIDDLVKFATDEKRSYLKVKFPPEYFIKTMLQLSADLVPLFCILDWQICFSDKQHAFIISDNPFLLIPGEKPDPFYGVGLMTPKAQKILPLTSNICLVMREPSKSPKTIYTDVNDKIIYQKINNFQLMNSERFIFSPVRGKLEKIIKELKPWKHPRKAKVLVS